MLQHSPLVSPRGALEEAIAYAKERKQFGKPISYNQGVSFMLADMATEIEAARNLIYSAARAKRHGCKRCFHTVLHGKILCF